jgi:hypothetical protein
MELEAWSLELGARTGAVAMAVVVAGPKRKV